MNVYAKISTILLLFSVIALAVNLEPIDLTGAAIIQSDTTQPSINEVNYLSNLNQGQTQTISANITDDVNISAVLFNINSADITISSSNSIYSYSYQPIPGDHDVIITANDTSNNQASTSISFTVNDTAPPAIILNYLSNVEFGSPQTITATITDNVNVSQVLLEKNNANTTLTSSTSTYVYSYTPAILGIHTFKIHAKDASNNQNTVTGSFTVSEYLNSNSTIIDSTITPDSEIIDSTVKNSIVNSSTIINSYVENMTVLDGNIVNDILYAGTITYKGKTHSKQNLPLDTIYDEDSYCGDSTCNSNEACYTCAEDCGSCSYQTTVIDELSNKNKLTQLFENIPDNKEIEILADDPILPVTKIQIKITDPITSAKLELIKDTTSSTSSAYRLFQIQTTNLTSDDVGDIYVFFRVKKTWFSENYLTHTTVKLQKKVNSDWDDLTTSYLSEDNTYYTYKSTLTSFSDFRITANETPSVCGNGIIESGETQQTCCRDVGCSQGYTCQGTACVANLCGNGVCDPTESSQTCLQDCPTVCGNGICESNENYMSCAKDCKPPAPRQTTPNTTLTEPSGLAVGGACGNGVCDPNETPTSCPQDCETNLFKSTSLKYAALIVFILVAIFFVLSQLGYFESPPPKKRPIQRPKQIKTIAQPPPQQIQPTTPSVQIPPELERYVDICIHNQIPPSQVKQILTNSGWQPELVDYILQLKRYF